MTILGVLCKMPICGSSKFILPLHTWRASTLIPDGLSAASDLDPRETGSCGIYFRASKRRSHRGSRVMWRPSFDSVFNQLSCLLSGGGGEARILGALFLLAVAVVCEVQSRHLQSFRSPLFNHLGITVFQNGIRLGARSFPGLWPSLRALAGGVGSYGTSQDSGKVLLLSPQEEMQNSTKH